MDKQVISLTIFLIKDHVHEFKDCIKAPYCLSDTAIKREYGLEGIIYYSDSKKKPPRWKPYLDAWGQDAIDITDNASNKAIMLVKVEDRIMAVVFGYGRSFLKEDCIERNFGFKVALNTIDPNKMRSVNAATIIDTILKMECISDTTENKVKSFKDLGADIPYGFFEKDAIVEGIGDEIYTLEEQINKSLVLVNPGVFVSTKNVFLENEHYSNKLSHKYIQENVNNDDLYQNDLEAATFKIYPDLANIKYRLSKYGKVVMSGTGSSFIVHTENDIKIKEENPNYLVVKIN